MEERKNFKKQPLSQYIQYRFATFILQKDGNQRHKQFGNSKESFTNHREERLSFLDENTDCHNSFPRPIHTQKSKSKCKTCLQQHTTDRGGKRLACCITGSQSRLANDGGTWLCCRSLACLRGVTDGGGTPDVDADRPSLQLTFGSVDKGKRNYQLSQVSSDYRCLLAYKLSFCVSLCSFHTQILVMFANHWQVMKQFYNN